MLPRPLGSYMVWNRSHTREDHAFWEMTNMGRCSHLVQSRSLVQRCLIMGEMRFLGDPEP